MKIRKKILTDKMWDFLWEFDFVHVCVCERERERERGAEIKWQDCRKKNENVEIATIIHLSLSLP